MSFCELNWYFWKYTERLFSKWTNAGILVKENYKMNWIVRIYDILKTGQNIYRRVVASLPNYETEVKINYICEREQEIILTDCNFSKCAYAMAPNY